MLLIILTTFNALIFRCTFVRKNVIYLTTIFVPIFPLRYAPFTLLNRHKKSAEGGNETALLLLTLYITLTPTSD